MSVRVRHLHGAGYSVADNILAGLMCIGYQVNPGAKILDFGCGGGGLVYEMRKLGYDAYGFDIHNYLSRNDPENAQFFGFASTGRSDTSDTRVDWSTAKIPFEDDTFDLVISTAVFEHVLDWPPAMAEIARVMRHDGIGLHLFPSRNVLIEPHMFVPLATKVQSWWWFYLWALLGIRNEYQAGMSAREVADRNYRYSQTGVRYQRDCDMRAAGGQHFGAIYFVDTQFHAGSTWRENLRAARSAIFSRHPLRALGTLPRFRALFVTKPVHRSRDAADQQTGWGR